MPDKNGRHCGSGSLLRPLQKGPNLEEGLDQDLARLSWSLIQGARVAMGARTEPFDPVDSGPDRGALVVREEMCLDCSIDVSWLIGFVVWFVVGRGVFREGPGSPRNPDAWHWAASRGPPEFPGPGPKSLKINTFLSSSHIWTLDFSFDGGTENFTKCHYNLSPGLVLGAFCTICRAGTG